MIAKVRYTIKTPLQKGTASFSIICDRIMGTERIQKKVSDARIDAINEAFRKGKPIEECVVLIREIKESLVKQLSITQTKPAHHLENMRLVYRYYNERYLPRRNLRTSSKESMLYDLKRAVNCLGPLSLVTATQEQIQACTHKFSATKQRRLVARLRQLLKFCGRNDIELQTDFKCSGQIRFLEMSEIESLLEIVKSDRVLSCLIGIGSKAGLRLGEIYALKPHWRKAGNQLYVTHQMLSDGTIREPKRNRKRNAFVIDDGMEYVDEWLQLPEELKLAYRKGENRIPKAVKKACKAIFKDSSKHLNFHDTRHCYAVHMVSKGVSTDLLAKAMGNSPTVCVENYQGFILSDTGMEMIDVLLRRAKERGELPPPSRVLPQLT
ncbi:MAG TPA: site-specific integrase [Bacteriovoracaceae bacterium]|nr:site-specific integrase [Bacteriovoracaceae bacterium]